jgi:hypothetical protein
MLIRTAILERIKAGNVSLAFRRWQRATVKSGSTLRTAVGVLRIQQVEKVALNVIAQSDAHDAGYPNLDTLLDELQGQAGHVYRIELAYDGEDPRIALRRDDHLTAEALSAVVGRLQRLDARSTSGAWTEPVLSAIDAFPMAPAAALAAHVGFEKGWLKVNIRKLKALGLTISHHPGYELSPRGIAVLDNLKKRTLHSG